MRLEIAPCAFPFTPQRIPLLALFIMPRHRARFTVSLIRVWLSVGRRGGVRCVGAVHAEPLDLAVDEGDLADRLHAAHRAALRAQKRGALALYDELPDAHIAVNVPAAAANVDGVSHLHSNANATCGGRSESSDRGKASNSPWTGKCCTQTAAPLLGRQKSAVW